MTINVPVAEVDHGSATATMTATWSVKLGEGNLPPRVSPRHMALIRDPKLNGPRGGSGGTCSRSSASSTLLLRLDSAYAQTRPFSIATKLNCHRHCAVATAIFSAAWPQEHQAASMSFPNATNVDMMMYKSNRTPDRRT